MTARLPKTDASASGAGASASTPTQGAVSKQVGASDAGAPLILLVDDERSVRRSVKLILESLGYAVVLAEDGLEGAERFAEHHEELAGVLLDMVMPKLGGVGAFKRMRSINAGVPIIVCSGYAPGEDIRTLEREGLSAFLAKPYNRKQLCAVLEENLERTP